MSPRGVYSSLQERYFGSAKRVFSGFQEVYIFVLDGYVWETHPYTWCTTSFSLIESYISFIRWDCEIAFFFKMGIHQCGVWFKDLPRFDNCQKHVRCILPLENGILLTFERDTGEYYTSYERGILYLLKGVYYNPERGIL